MSVPLMQFHGSLDASQTALSHSNYAERLFDSSLFSDCTVRSQHLTWHLHRAILSQRCEFFQACFLHRFKESSIDPQEGILLVSMHDDDPVAVGRMLKWLYTLEYPTLGGVDLDYHGKKTFGTDGKTNTDLKPNHKAYSEVDVSSHIRNIPANFYTSEIALFAIADKYNLPDLATQASSSIRSILALPSSFPETTNPCYQTYVNSINMDDFISMLEILYLDLSSTSTQVKQCRQDILRVATAMIADLSKANIRLQDLLASSTEFIVDVLESLKGTIDGLKPRSSRSSISSARSARSLDMSGNESVTSFDGSPRRSFGEHAGVVEKVYIPMNEDSDAED